MFLLFLALLPSILLFVYIFRKDKVEKEPLGLLFKIFLLGGLSIIPAVFLEQLASIPLDAFFEEGSAGYIIFENFLGVALIEEWTKRGAARMGAWKHPAFDYKFDAIVYCVVAALGFATLENIMYVFEYGAGTAIMRAVLSVPSHAIDGIIMGYFFGLAKQFEIAGSKRKKRHYYRLSLIVPTISHGLFDAALSTDSDIIMLAFFVIVLIVDIWAFLFVRKQSREDRPLYMNGFYQNNVNGYGNGNPGNFGGSYGNGNPGNFGGGYGNGNEGNFFK